jgi:hypothetical protein
MKNSTILSLALLSSLTAGAFAQGSLTPPAGPPVASMKTLDQVEARTSVQSLAAAPPYNITQPGSYYLTGNITVASGDAITITSNDVSIDLNGFTIRSTQTGAASGGAIANPAVDIKRLTVRNGSIVSGGTTSNGTHTAAGFQYGIADGSKTITGSVVTDVRVVGVSRFGIYLDRDGVVDRCTVSDCGDHGIYADIVNNCTVTGLAGNGIYAGAAVSNCRGDGYTGYGIQSVNASHCRGFAFIGTGISCTQNADNCTGESNSSIGLQCVVATNCTAASTSGAGISATSVANSRGTSTSGVGITASNATNCEGRSTGGPFGMSITGTASFCRGFRAGGVAIQAAIAVACTSGGGTITGNKQLGTP